MGSFLDNLLAGFTQLETGMPIMALLVASLWLLQCLNWMMRYKLNMLGIYPRHPFGLIGIAFSPLLHQDFRHLFLNSIPLFILLSFIFVYGPQTLIQLTIVIVLLSGLGIWFFGRRGIHIGASALVMGYFGFILAVAIKTQNPLAIIIAVVCLFYLGSLIGSLFPTRDRTSWEGHLAGFLAGIAYVFF
jgi:membrane associated rhomboid family serine protease